MKSRVLKWVLMAAVGWFLAVGMLGWAFFRYGQTRHQHCILQAGVAVRLYADENGGSLPFHTNGFGDALVLLVREDLANLACVCGPGDDGTELRYALAHDLHVPEEKCSRVYVQGLHMTNDPAIAVLFDRQSVRGGDHGLGFGPPVREVCLLDGSMVKVFDQGWPEFAARQVELLLAAGWTREAALKYYPDAKPKP